MPRVGPGRCQYCNEKSTPDNPVFRYVEKLDSVSKKKVLATKGKESYGRSFFLHEECKRIKLGNFIIFRDAYQGNNKAYAR